MRKTGDRRRPRGRSRTAPLVLAPALLAGGAMLAIAGPGLRPGSPGVAVAVAADVPYTITGRGNGHGRGMGQWGAFGYAQQGWAADRILTHYYYGDGVALDQVPPTAIEVRLMGRDDKPLEVRSAAGMTVAGRHVEPDQAVRLTPAPDGGAHAAITAGCGGAEIWAGDDPHPWVDPVGIQGERSDGTDSGPDRPADGFLTLCDGGAAYRGALGVASENGAIRTVNRVDLEDYLLGVVGSEMPPDWADRGGAEALRAQAIAARSYALADRRYDYAQTCDTQACQVYGGVVKEDPRSTDAVRSTAGTVLLRDGQPYRAEYSASTGGATTTGVPDAGDAVAPQQTWSRTLTAGQIGHAFEVGELRDITVTGRDPSGRVTALRVAGTGGTVDVDGERARGALELPSDWFDVAPGTDPPPAPPAPEPSPAAPEPPPAPAPSAPESSAPELLAAPAPPVPEPATAPGPPAAPAAPPAPESRPAAAVATPTAIDDKYRELGGPAGSLGAPLGPELDLPGAAGRFRSYTNGVIVWTSELGARVMDLNFLTAPAQ